LIISKTVLDADNNPIAAMSCKSLPGINHRETILVTYHKFVKTTPNPRATKKRSGELLGPPPPPPLSLPDVAALVLDCVAVAIFEV
jgi:hypothetical protein